MLIPMWNQGSEVEEYEQENLRWSTQEFEVIEVIEIVDQSLQIN